MLHVQPARGFHYIERADHIGIKIGARVFKAVPDPGLCSEVDNHIGSEFIRDTIEQRLIFNHAFSGCEVRVLQQHLVATLLEGDIVVVGHPVIPANMDPFIQQQLGKMEANKSRRSGYKDTHQRSISR